MSTVQSSDPTGLLRKPTTTPGAASGPGVGLPTRSKIDGWTDAVNDLSRFAEACGVSADRLEVAADAHVQQLSAPGGTDWDGAAADEARESSYADRGVVWQAADLMRAMQKVANQGAGSLSQARELALDAIAQAEADEFKVSDDLTVTDLRRYTSQQLSLYEARKTKAEQHHSYIAMRARTLASEDAKIGAELAAGAATLDQMIPLDWGKQPPAQPISDGDVQPYDNETDDEGSLTGEQIAERLREFRGGLNPRRIREVDSEDEIFDLYEEFSKGGTQLPVPDNYYDRRVLPDGTIIGVRESDDHGPTLDVKYPPGVTGPDKVHLPPPVAPPATPPTAGEAPVVAAPPDLPVIDHPPAPGLIPPWAQTPAGVPEGPYPFGGLPPGVGIASPTPPPPVPSVDSGPDWSPGPMVPSLTPEEQAGIGSVLFGGLLGFLGWLGTPKTAF